MSLENHWSLGDFHSWENVWLGSSLQAVHPDGGDLLGDKEGTLI
jgi:hypothetical protein